MSTIPVRLTWEEWWPVPQLQTEQDIRNFFEEYGASQEGAEELIEETKWLPVPQELLTKYRHMVTLRQEIDEAMRAIEHAHRKIPKPPTREDRNNKRRLAKRGGAR